MGKKLRPEENKWLHAILLSTEAKGQRKEKPCCFLQEVLAPEYQVSRALKKAVLSSLELNGDLPQGVKPCPSHALTSTVWIKKQHIWKPKGIVPIKPAETAKSIWEAELYVGEFVRLTKDRLSQGQEVWKVDFRETHLVGTEEPPSSHFPLAVLPQKSWVAGSSPSTQARNHFHVLYG